MKTVLLLTPFLLLGHLSIAQYSTDGLDLNQPVSEWYDNQIGLDQSKLVIGQYKRIKIEGSGHPFYKSRLWSKGVVRYRGQQYTDIKLLYNIYEDYLILQHPSDDALASQPIQLDYDLLDGFFIENDFFKKYTLTGEEPTFYHLISKGKNLDFVARRLKKHVLGNTTNPAEYEPDDDYYLIVDETKFLIRNKKSFMNAFPELAKSIQAYVKVNRLTIKPSNPADLLKLSVYCDQKLTEQ